MKRILEIVIVIALVFSLAACGSTDGDVHGTVESAQTVGSEDPDEGFAIGTAAGSVYKNTFLGITAEFGDDWHLLSDGECRALNEQTLGSFDEDYAEVIKNADYFYDMMAGTEGYDRSVNVVMQKLGPQAATLDLEQMLEQSSQQLTTAYANMGYTDYRYDIGRSEFLGNEYVTGFLTAKLNGVDFFMRQLVFTRGSYCVSISASSTGSDSCESILGMFSAIK